MKSEIRNPQSEMKWIVKLHGRYPLRFVKQGIRHIYEITTTKEATRFEFLEQAHTAARKHGIKVNHFEVEEVQ